MGSDKSHYKDRNDNREHLHRIKSNSKLNAGKLIAESIKCSRQSSSGENDIGETKNTVLEQLV
jgi:hypothetical protein